MRFQTLGDKREIVSLRCRASEAISAGQPVCLEVDGTEDGLSVALPATAGADFAHALFFGVALETLAANQLGDVQVFGFCSSARIIRAMTRSATSANWVSVATQAKNVALDILTASNAFQTVVGTIAATGFLPFAVLAETLAGIASVASGTSDTDNTITYFTTSAKIFLRAM